MPESRSGDQWLSMHAYSLTEWVLFDFLSFPIYGYSQRSTLVATTLRAAFVAVVRSSNLWYYGDNTVPLPRASFDLFQLRLVCQSPSNVAVMHTEASLHWGGTLSPLRNSAVCFCAGSLLEEASMRACISRVQLKVCRAY